MGEFKSFVDKRGRMTDRDQLIADGDQSQKKGGEALTFIKCLAYDGRESLRRGVTGAICH